MENYIQLRVLGKGSFGSAWLVQRRGDKALFVAKEVRIASMKPAERESAKREIDMLRTLNHPNITKYVDHFEHRGSLFIVMEYANGGDMYTAIKNRKGNRFTEHEILYYFTQLCLALLHLHEHHILHRDLKTQNVFLTSNGVVKLGDFGISTVLRNTFELKRTVCGTPYYFSPELCLNKPYNNKSDVWALGCILYELTTLTHAFDGTNMKALVQKILKGSYPPIHSSYSANLSKLISAMLQIDPRQRPNVGQVVALPYMRESLSHLRHAVEAAHRGHCACAPSAPSAAAAAGAGAAKANGPPVPLAPAPALSPGPAPAPQAQAQAQVQSPSRQQLVARRLEERRRDEQAKVSQLVRERQLLRAQLERKNREHEERLRKARDMQRAAEVEAHNKRLELEARVREQRRVQEQRARAQAVIQKQREEEWERNMREQAEENRRRERDVAQQAREKAEDDALCERIFCENNNYRGKGHNNEPVDPRSPPALSAAAAAELYRDMRRQAALNKQRMLEDMQAGEAQRPPPENARQQNKSPSPRPPPRVKPTSGAHIDDEEARRRAFWQMRIEAEENRRRALGQIERRMSGEQRQEKPLEKVEEKPPEKAQEKLLEKAQERPPGKPREKLIEKAQEKPLVKPREKPLEKAHEKPLKKAHEKPPEMAHEKPLENAHEKLPDEVHEKPPENADEKPPEKVHEKPLEKLPDDLSLLHVSDNLVTESETEEAAVRRDEDYSALQTVIGAALTQQEKLDEGDFNDDAFPDVDPTKFMLDGHTIILPNVNASDPLMHRIESLRLFLEGELGDDALMMCYRQMNNIAVDDDGAMQRVADVLPESHQKFIPVIAQLIVCEDAFNRQLVQ